MGGPSLENKGFADVRGTEEDGPYIYGEAGESWGMFYGEEPDAAPSTIRPRDSFAGDDPTGRKS